MKKMSAGKLISKIIIWAVVIGFTLSCLLPLWNMIAISFSGSDAVAANEVGLIPKDVNFTAYSKLLNDSQFWKSFLISVERVVLGLAINMFFTVTMAYPLSKSKRRFPAREIYIKFVIFAMLFSDEYDLVSGSSGSGSGFQCDPADQLFPGSTGGIGRCGADRWRQSASDSDQDLSSGVSSGACDGRTVFNRQSLERLFFRIDLYEQSGNVSSADVHSAVDCGYHAGYGCGAAETDGVYE